MKPIFVLRKNFKWNPPKSSMFRHKDYLETVLLEIP